ncbi:hypothetical protein H072_3519 [Dactylellina haptotyla CBS 200.50]|uniref:F-box domain-containing protein n=1 Tax=Dactylellina haptotyla (strain CBS 200.50) TaxID=1284197 RepID=S8BSP7_DACHA|nr:hypothetical protein H072_3519 [Dactylellina haptotyla CBS 200.50]
MPLFSLPTELILQVLSYIQDRKSLVSLACSCRVFQRMAEAYLYSSFVFLQRDEIKLLHDSTMKDPRRLRYIQALEQRFSFHLHTDGEAQLIDICTLPNLRNFVSESPLGQYYASKKHLEQWKVDKSGYLETFKRASLLTEGPRPLGNLRSLILHWTGAGDNSRERFWQDTDICPIFLMPALEALEISCGLIVRQRDKPAGLIEGFKNSTNLKSLTLTECLIDHGALINILSYPKALEQLTILEPMCDWIDAPQPEEGLPLVFIHTDSVNRAIAQQAGTLRYLQLSRRRQGISKFSRMVLNLGGLRKLSTLKIEPVQTIELGQDSHWELADLVPPALDTLHLYEVRLHWLNTIGGEKIMARFRVDELIANAATRGAQFTLDVSAMRYSSQDLVDWKAPVREKIMHLENAFYKGELPDVSKMTEVKSDGGVPRSELRRRFPRLRVMTSKYLGCLPPFLYGERVPPNAVRYDSWYSDRFLASPYMVENGMPEAEDEEAMDPAMLEAFAS